MKALLFTLAACSAVPVAPHVLLVTDRELPEYLMGASGWDPLGFQFTDQDTGMPECEIDWWNTGKTDCQISIGLVRDPFLRARYGTNAMADQMSRTITIDSSVTDQFALLIASAHEFGHLILQSGTHTKTGIMAGISYIMSEDDYALACETIHVCETIP